MTTQQTSSPTRALALAVAITLGLAACGGSSSPTPTPVPSPPTSSTDGDADGVSDSADNCVSDANPGQEDSDVDGAGDACDPIPAIYAFTNMSGADTVSYSGQTKRHILIGDLVDEINALTEDPAVNVTANLNFFFRFDASTSDSLVSSFDIGTLVMPDDGAGNLTYGSIGGAADLVSKIAGGDGVGGGETSRLINNEFIGWTVGADADPLPVEFVDDLFSRLATEATDGSTPQIMVAGGGLVPLDVVTIDANGIDYSQLIQKFLLMAVTFSQGTNDYFQTDFANALALEGANPYTAGEHDWDEAFGYFGGARDYGDYTIDEISGNSGRAEFAEGFHDLDGNGFIDIRSEFNFGQSVNCAKRDVATAGNSNPTNFTQDVFDAFLLGREVLKNASAAGELSAEEQAVLTAQIEQAAVTWEKCIAATVVHYINDVTSDMGNFDSASSAFADLDNFKSLAKHWAEMKGFAFGLQFSQYSPFRADAASEAELVRLLALMGDAPVLADGTQGGAAFAGGATQYVADLISARDILQTIYAFDTENVTNW